MRQQQNVAFSTCAKTETSKCVRFIKREIDLLIIFCVNVILCGEQYITLIYLV